MIDNSVTDANDLSEKELKQILKQKKKERRKQEHPIASALAIIEYILAGVIYIFSLYLAYRLSNFAVLIGTALLPVVGQVYWFIKMIIYATWLNWYSLLIYIFLILLIPIGIAFKDD